MSLSKHRKEVSEQIAIAESNINSLIKKLDRAVGYSYGLDIAELAHKSCISDSDMKEKLTVRINGLDEACKNSKNCDTVLGSKTYPKNYDFQSLNPALGSEFYRGGVEGIVDGAKALRKIDLSRQAGVAIDA